MRFGMSGSLDCHVILWNLTNGSVECASLLSGPCRCMSILCEDVDSVDSNGARARILAGSGEGVAELAVSVRQGAVTVTQLKFVSAYVEVSSLSYFHGNRQEIDQGCWPKSFLGAMKVAVGSVDGQLALLQGGSCRAVHELFKSRHGNRDVVSIVTWRPSRESKFWTNLNKTESCILTVLRYILFWSGPVRAVEELQEPSRKFVPLIDFVSNRSHRSLSLLDNLFMSRNFLLCRWWSARVAFCWSVEQESWPFLCLGRLADSKNPTRSLRSRKSR